MVNGGVGVNIGGGVSSATIGQTKRSVSAKKRARAWGGEPLNLDSFYDWWHSLKRGSEAVPHVQDFIPSKLQFSADWAYCMEREPCGMIRAKYWGVALEALSAQPILGVNYLSLFGEEDAALLEEHHDHICSIPCGGYMERTFLTIDGRSLKFRNIDLPLMDKDGVVSHVCGVSDLMEEHVPSMAQLRSKIVNQFDKFRYFDLEAGPKTEEWAAE